jgi:hypothetical protein
VGHPDPAAPPAGRHVRAGVPVRSPLSIEPPDEPNAETVALRRCVLAAAVIDDVDVFPQAGDGGVVLRDVPVAHGRRPSPVRLTWAQVAEATAGHDLDSPLARQRLTRWLHLVWWLAELPAEMLQDGARLVGLPRGHVHHPGERWAVARVLGGALDVGFGVAGLGPAVEGESEVVVVPPSAVRAAGVDPQSWLAPADERLARLSELAAQRRARDPRSPVTPYGDADVLTLLAGRALRAQLAGCEGDGIALVAAPTRIRGWTRFSSIDPAYIPLVYRATPPELRGFPAALLVTADEVVLARAGPHAGLALRDAGPPEPRQIVLRA